MISQTIIYDEKFNFLSLEAQNIFIRILAISDDCGVVPAHSYTLKTLTNPPEKLKSKFDAIISEILEATLLIKFSHSSKDYYCFKKESFEDYQAYLIKNRTKSEYLKISKDEFLELYSNFPKILEFPESER